MTTPSPRFLGHRALVTGASSGIGRATAGALARAGARVAALARDRAALEALAAELQAEGAEVHVICADLREPAARAAAVEESLGALGGLDLLVNAAGVIGSGTIETTAPDALSAMMELNVTAPMHLMQGCVEALAESGGSVVNVSSVTGLRAFPGILAYATSKAALDQLTRCAALELAPRGVRVNAVNPGVVRTELHKRAGMDEARYAAFVEHSRSTHPLGRIGEPEEVAAAILYLASPVTLLPHLFSAADCWPTPPPICC
jgi:NAD(P)-dependent dehydrogenase (short-subunit alcohol dehydrogenase family)